MYPTKVLSASELCHALHEALMAIELNGLRVRAVVCDGAGANRSLLFTKHAGDFPDDPVITARDITSRRRGLERGRGRRRSHGIYTEVLHQGIGSKEDPGP